MAKQYPLSPLGASHNSSEQSFDPTYEQKPFYNTAIDSDYGRSYTTLAAEQVHKSSVLQWWWMEICASVISILTMFSLIAILYRFDGKPLQTWNHGIITVNTIVAAVSTLNRVSLMFPVSGAISQAMWIWFASTRKTESCKSKIGDMEVFDEASRGAWGSMVLLWRLKTTAHLASIGAILTIASLAFDIFTQQVMGYQSINVAGTNGSLAGDVPRVEQYAAYTHGAVMSSWIPTLPAKAALRNSFFATSISTPSVACSTGNCTWPVVPSLAVCGECKPMTYIETCEPLNNLSSYNSCNYTMESGTSITVVDEQLSMNLVFLSKPITTGTAYNLSNPTIPYISTFDMMYTSYNTSTPIPTWTNISATECALWFCIQAYKTTINDSTASQTSTNWSTIEAIDNPSSNISATRTFTIPPEEMNIAPNSSYSVLGESLTAFKSFIWSESMFTGNISAGIAETASSSDYMLELWYQSGDLDAWIKRLAMGMTNYMRTLDPSVYEPDFDTGIYNGTAHPYYGGTAFFNQVFVKVRWQWLTFPLGLIVLSVLFLILSIIRTRGSSIGAWKSSPLALLFADVDPVIREHAGAKMNVACGLRDSVGETKALLKPEFGGRWILRSHR